MANIFGLSHYSMSFKAQNFELSFIPWFKEEHLVFTTEYSVSETKIAKIRLYLTSVLICYTTRWCLQSLTASEVVAGFADNAQIDLT